MAEAKAVLTGELRPIRHNQLLPYERGEEGRHLALLRRERLDRAAMERLALDRRTLEDAPLRRAQPVEASSDHRSQRRRDDNVGRVLRDMRPSPRRTVRCRRRRVRSCPEAPAGPARRSARRRLRRAAAPSLRLTGHVGRSSVSSGRATHTRSSGLPDERSATCSTRSRKVGSPHWMSSKTTTSSSSAAARSSALRNAQAISSGDVAESLSPRRERIAATAVSSSGRTPSCFSTSTTGQYVMPSPYGRQRP